jgi:chromosome segregation ATPase
MIEPIMYFGIGFCVAGLAVLIVVPIVHGRAVRLTTRQLEEVIPSSMAEVQADKDLLRAQFAMSTRRLEMKIEQFRTKGASQLAEIGKKADAINQLKTELGALREQLLASEANSAVNADAARVSEERLAKAKVEADNRCHAVKREAEYVLSEKEALAEHSALADSQSAGIAAMTMQVQTLKDQLAQASDEANAADDRCRAAKRDAEHALSAKESDLARLTETLAERLALADSQSAEIAALTMQVRKLNDRLGQAGEEVREAENRCNAQHVDLNAATHALMEERAKSENFHHRVAELTQQVVAQTNRDKNLARRTQEDLETRLSEQSRLLNKAELERNEIEIAHKAEYDLRSAMIEIESRANAAAQNFMAENARLQSILDRANGERTRLAYELANARRQEKDAQAA